MPEVDVRHDHLDRDRQARDADTQNDEAPLLDRQQHASTSFDVEQADDESLRQPGRMLNKFRIESVRLFFLSAPLMVQQFLAFSAGLISVAFVGHLGEFELGVIVLANSLYTVSGVTVLMGTASAMETLCGQAYGAQNYEALGVIFQRALCLCGFVSCGILALWTQLEPILLFIGQEPTIAAATARYTLATVPSLLLLGISECGKRFLMAQNVVTPLAVVFTLGTLTAPLYNWLFIFALDWGVIGAAAALAAVNATDTFLLVAYIVWYNWRLQGTEKQPWHGWSTACLKNIPQYLKISVPSMLMLCLEWWLFEAMIILSGLLQHPELNLAAMGVLLNVIATIYTFPYGLSGAVSTRVSNELGRGNHRGAAMTALTSLIIVVSGQLLLGLGMVFGRSIWAYAFTSEAEVVALTATVFPIVAAAAMGDGANAVMAGVIRGCGRQGRAALLNAVTYWVFGLPVSWLLAFQLGMGITGLWLGLFVTTSVQAVAISTMVLRLNWRREAERAASLNQQETEVLKASQEEGSVAEVDEIRIKGDEDEDAGREEKLVAGEQD